MPAAVMRGIMHHLRIRPHVAEDGTVTDEVPASDFWNDTCCARAAFVSFSVDDGPATRRVFALAAVFSFACASLSACSISAASCGAVCDHE